MTSHTTPFPYSLINKGIKERGCVDKLKAAKGAFENICVLKSANLVL
jgi:hypothetical protein